MRCRKFTEVIPHADIDRYSRSPNISKNNFVNLIWL